MNIGRFPDRPTPIGCLIGLLALFPGVFSAVSFWGAYKALMNHPPRNTMAGTLCLWGIVAGIPALLGLAFSIIRLARIGKR